MHKKTSDAEGFPPVFSFFSSKENVYGGRNSIPPVISSHFTACGGEKKICCDILRHWKYCGWSNDQIWKFLNVMIKCTFLCTRVRYISLIEYRVCDETLNFLNVSNSFLVCRKLEYCVQCVYRVYILLKRRRKLILFCYSKKRNLLIALHCKNFFSFSSFSSPPPPFPIISELKFYRLMW